MNGPYLLAIDAGTGSCRALLFTTQGEQAAVALQEWTHHEPPGVPGGQDFDVHANWLAIAACIRETLRLAGADGARLSLRHWSKASCGLSESCTTALQRTAPLGAAS